MSHVDILSDWSKRLCILATMHQKELVVAPLFKSELGISITVLQDFNTDRFGTFTRDVKRVGNQIESARAKAFAAMDISGADMAIASEGTFGANSSMPFISSNFELMLLVDKKNNLEIAGHYNTSSVQAKGQRISSSEEALSLAISWGFPNQGVIVRESENSNNNIYKEIITADELRQVSERLLSRLFVKTIFIETDMRAHRCPDRMESIRKATIDLIKNCKSLCHNCKSPGFVITDTVKGLPCKNCKRETNLTKENIFVCRKCQYQEIKLIKGKIEADPGDCDWCNP